jgi:hypothetical protein
MAFKVNFVTNTFLVDEAEDCTDAILIALRRHGNDGANWPGECAGKTKVNGAFQVTYIRYSMGGIQ